MTTNSLDNQVIALAALTQACLVTTRIARKGQIQSEFLNPLVHSLFEMNPVDTPSIYAGVANLKPGLKSFQGLISGKSDTEFSADILRYQLNLLYLEPQLSKHRDMLSKIGHGLEAIALDFPDANSRTELDCLQKVSDLYQNTVSTLNKRIQIKGEYNHLNRPANTISIRVSLLAGIRAAVLWRQNGGKRIHLLLKRRLLAESAEKLLKRS